MHFKRKLMNQASEYGKKSKFWARFWTVWPKCGSQILFSWVLLLWDVRHCCKLLSYSISRNFFFSIRVFFKGTVDSQDRRGKGGDHLLFHSTTSTRSRTLRHFQLCMWDDHHVFLIATLVFTRLLLDEIYHLIKLPFKWLIDDAMFVYLNWY